MVVPFDASRNRNLRSELAHQVDSSRQRVGHLNHGAFDADGLTPTVARRALKDGQRTPLELVRSEVRARIPPRERGAAQFYEEQECYGETYSGGYAGVQEEPETTMVADYLGPWLEPAAAAVTAEPPDSARELPPMV